MTGTGGGTCDVQLHMHASLPSQSTTDGPATPTSRRASRRTLGLLAVAAASAATIGGAALASAQSTETVESTPTFQPIDTEARVLGSTAGSGDTVDAAADADDGAASVAAAERTDEDHWAEGWFDEEWDCPACGMG